MSLPRKFSGPTHDETSQGEVLSRERVLSCTGTRSVHERTPHRSPRPRDTMLSLAWADREKEPTQPKLMQSVLLREPETRFRTRDEQKLRGLLEWTSGMIFHSADIGAALNWDRPQLL